MTKYKDDHVHKLLLHRYRNGKETYFCVNDCDFKITPELSLGRAVECWRCGNSFRMNSYSLTLKKPHCEDCHIRKKDLKTKSKRPVAVVRSGNISSEVANDIANKSIDDLMTRLNSPTIVDEDL